MPIIHIYDAATQLTTEREMNEEELVQYEADQVLAEAHKAAEAEAKAAEEAAKQQAFNDAVAAAVAAALAQQ